MIPQAQLRTPGESTSQAPSQSLAGQAEDAARAIGQPLAQLLVNAMVAAVVAMVAIGIYDVSVRQPRTLRLAVVDVARLYELAHAKATRNALTAMEAVEAQGAASSPRSSSEQASDALTSFYRTPQEFGPALSRAMEDLSKQCSCTLVAMSTVFGANSNVPDYTDLVATSLGLAAQALAAAADDGGKP